MAKAKSEFFNKAGEIADKVVPILQVEKQATPAPPKPPDVSLLGRVLDYRTPPRATHSPVAHHTRQAARAASQSDKNDGATSQK